MSSDGPTSNSKRRRQPPALLIPLIGATIGFVAALFLLRELDIFESTPAPVEPTLGAACDYPLGTYYDQLCNLVARATVEIQTTISPEIATQCIDDEVECRTHRENLRRGLPTSERFRDALFDLEPPEVATDWHQRYLTAISLLHSGYHAQFQALLNNDRDALLGAHQRTLEAASQAADLFEDFQIAFTDERGP